MKRTVGILAAATFAASGLASGFMAPTGAHAQFSGCRSDPLVWLDNGVKVQLTSTVATDSSNIRTINYILHVPAGVHITRVVFTNGPARRLESLTPYYDARPGTYASDTVVTASVAADETATEAVVQTDSGWNGTVNGQGETNHDLLLSVRH